MALRVVINSGRPSFVKTNKKVMSCSKG